VERAQLSAAPPADATPHSGRALQLALLTLSTLAGAYLVTVMSPLQEAMRLDLSLSDNEMALLQGAARALAIAVAAIPLGFAIDRYSRVRLLLTFAAGGVAGSFFSALAPSFAWLFAARCLVGLTATASGTAAFSLLADLYAPEQRGRANMIVTIAQCVGIAVAFAAGGALLTWGGGTPSAWRWTMSWLTVPLIPAVFALLWMREPARMSRVPGKASIGDTWSKLWQARVQIAPVMAGLVMTQVALIAVLSWSAPVFSRSFALQPDRIGAIMATVVLVAGIIGPIAGGVLADLCQRAGGPRRTALMLAALALVCVPASLFPLLPAAASAIAVLASFMTVISAISVAGITLFTIVTPNELRGLCMATLAGAEVVLGVAVAPVAVSLLSGELGGPASIGTALAVTSAIACILAAGMFALGRKQVDRP
jgi:MFS family permease